MTATEFLKLSKDTPANQTAPAGLSPALLALWHDAQGNWELAHEAAQSEESPSAAWVHAYLHRKEGDRSNARFWYSKAKKPSSKLELQDEWLEIATELLANTPWP